MSTTDAVASNPFAALSAPPKTGGAAGAADDGSSRFLKLLVTQMQNQDPLNPMDNAQVTSQMAQINTVTGIDKLNQSIQAMSGQMMQSQALQGASLVGRSVLLEGNDLRFDASGKATGGFELASPADSVKVEVVSAAGRTIDTLDLGAQSAGRSGFEWQAPDGVSTQGVTFRVTAKNGSTPLTSTPLTTDSVRAVSTGGDTLTLELGSGRSTAFSAIKAFS